MRRRTACCPSCRSSCATSESSPTSGPWRSWTRRTTAPRSRRSSPWSTGSSAWGCRPSSGPTVRSRRFLVAEAARMPEPAELGDVAAEEERDRPVDDDAYLPGQDGELQEVVRAREEPAGEAAQRDAQHVCDALVAAERRNLAEHAVAVRLHVAGEV